MGLMLVDVRNCQMAVSMPPSVVKVKATNPGDESDTWTVQIERAGTAWAVTDENTTIVFALESDNELMIAAPGLHRAGMLPRRKLTGKDVADEMDMPPRQGATIAAFANWLMGVEE